MATSGSGLWRVGFVLSAVLVMIGGPLHPKGAMVEMLANPHWVPAHSLMLAGFVALLVGLILYRRARSLPARSARWTRLAVYATVLQVIEMALHTAAAVDAGNLAAGRSTPVLSVHLALAVVAYPVFGLTMIGWIVATARDRSLASPWISWIGIVGLLGHGAAAPLTIVFQIAWAPLLFPLLMLFALWTLLAGVWPLRSRAAAEVVATPAPS